MATLVGERDPNLPVFIIILEPAKNFYNSGDIIKGYVKTEFTFGYNYSYTSVRILCKGEETTCAHGITLTLPILPPMEVTHGSEQELYESKEYRYPFEFKLPNNLPTSWVSRVVSHQSNDDRINIRYTVEALIENMKSVKMQHPITFQTSFPFCVQETPSPSSYSVTTSSHVLKFKSVSVTVTLATTIFTVGEEIKFRVEYENKEGRNYNFVYVVMGETVIMGKPIRMPDKVPRGLEKFGSGGLQSLEKKNKSTFERTILTKNIDSQLNVKPSLVNSLSANVVYNLVLVITSSSSARPKNTLNVPIFFKTAGNPNMDHVGKQGDVNIILPELPNRN